jgi:hypothetical protein
MANREMPKALVPCHITARMAVRALNHLMQSQEIFDTDLELIVNLGEDAKDLLSLRSEGYARRKKK